MGGACSVPLRVVYGKHLQTTDGNELTFLGEDGKVYESTFSTQKRTKSQDLSGRLKLYVDGTEGDYVYGVSSATDPNLPSSVGRTTKGGFASRGIGGPCLANEKARSMMVNLRHVTLVLCILAIGGAFFAMGIFGASAACVVCSVSLILIIFDVFQLTPRLATHYMEETGEGFLVD